MVKINAQQVKKLRQLTDTSVMACKEALMEAGGDIDRALQLLKKRGEAVAREKAERDTHEGTIAAYVHTNGRVGALVELHCETDFVAKNKLFQELARQLAVQVAGFDPTYVSIDAVPEPEKDRIKKQLLEEMNLKDKPAAIKEKAVQGKLLKILAERSLLSQRFYKDEAKIIEDLLKEYIAKLGENIQIARFVRFSLK